jgi:hypothetical protein
VTAAAAWQASNTSIFTVAAGLVTAAASAVGESYLTAAYQNRSANVSVVVLPTGTGILTGLVRESSFPIAGARIEVVGGSYAGRSTTSDGSGNYRLYGVAGDLQIRVSTVSHVPQNVRVNVAPLATPRRDQVLNFDLTSSSRVLSLAGVYRATLRASGTCGSSIPADAAVRNYVATIAQEGSRLSVVMNSAELGTIEPGTEGNRFEGRARPDSVEFLIGSGSSYYYYYYYYSWGIVERLNPPPVGPWGIVQSLYLTFAGTAAGPATPSTISAVLNGSLALHDAPAGFGRGRRQVSSCRARDHQLVMTRQ